MDEPSQEKLNEFEAQAIMQKVKRREERIKELKKGERSPLITMAYLFMFFYGVYLVFSKDLELGMGIVLILGALGIESQEIDRRLRAVVDWIEDLHSPEKDSF